MLRSSGGAFGTSLRVALCGLLIALGLVVPSTASAAATTDLGMQTIDGKDNIFGAGHAAPPNGGLMPVRIPLPAGSAGQAIVLSSAKGGVTMGVNAPSPGPDGGYDPDLPTNVTAFGGISGVIGDAGLGAFLGGVFTSDSEPTVAGTPPTINYSASAVAGTTTSTTTAASYPSILLNQLFFMGDGLTDEGVQQQFIVPRGATTLWLGLVDAGYYQGPPAGYDGDTGGYTVTVGVAASATGPIVTGVNLVVAPRTGTITTEFSLTETCPSPPIGGFVTGSALRPATPRFYLVGPGGETREMTVGPSLQFRGNTLSADKVTRLMKVKLGPDLVFAEAGGKVQVQGVCGNGNNAKLDTPITITIVQNTFAVVGDSYSAGEGNRPFTAATDLNPPISTATGCHRSSTGWAYKVAAANGLANPTSTTDEPSAWTFAACSGADIPDLTNSSRKYAGDGEVEVAQLNAITSSTTVVASTIGGNDVGFAKILKACIVSPVPGAEARCSRKGSAIRRHTDTALTNLGAHLRTAYTAVLGRMAPTGTLYVAGYPHLFGSTKSNFKGFVNNWVGIPTPACGIGAGYSFSWDDAKWINKETDRGDQTIASTVQQINSELIAKGSHRRIVFVDEQNGLGGANVKFANHGLCDNGDSYINGLFADVAHLGRFQTSFHPNLKGQLAYAQAFESYMGVPLSSS